MTTQRERIIWADSYDGSKENTLECFNAGRDFSDSRRFRWMPSTARLIRTGYDSEAIKSSAKKGYDWLARRSGAHGKWVLVAASGVFASTVIALVIYVMRNGARDDSEVKPGMQPLGLTHRRPQRDQCLSLNHQG